MLKDFISLMFPRTCIHCNDTLLYDENFICITCKSDIPKTDDLWNDENALFQKFAFIPQVETASAFLYFNKRGVSQKFLHQLKYKGQHEIGFLLGSWFGKQLKTRINADLIIPVPLHPSRMRIRGFNQSEHIADGIASMYDNLKVEKNLISRHQQTSSQTKKGKIERWKGMQNIYSDCSQSLKDKTVMVVDDVVTTGATVGMLCDKLVEAGANKIHIACIARR